MRRTPDVLVVGGGVIGCATARALCAAGRSVLLVDQGAIGGEASGAAAGVLSVGSSTEEGAALALRAASRARFPLLAAALLEETGIDVGFAVRGVVALCRSDAEEVAGRARLAARRSAGFAGEWVDAQALRRRVPVLHPELLGGAAYPDDALVNAPRLVEALASSARRRGAGIIPGAAVTAAELHGERVTRVRVGAEWVSPGEIVLAAGAWCDVVPGLAVGLGVEPVRGEMLAIDAAAPPDCPILTLGDGFLVPGERGEVRVGATFAEVGFSRGNTAEGLSRLADWVARMAPGWTGAPITRLWGGLRPFCRAGGPVIARVAGRRNLVVATGHYRSGILLAPITAERVQAVLEGGMG